jgi:hypothetical protein
MKSSTIYKEGLFLSLMIVREEKSIIESTLSFPSSIASIFQKSLIRHSLLVNYEKKRG